MCIKLSVVVPVYNTKDYLEQCIDSILKQSFENIELILVDDGSTDGSADICDAYASKDKRVSVYHRVNSGPLLSRKFGVEKAVGDYVTFVDADDFVAEESFALALEDMNQGIDVISFDIMRYFEEDDVITDLDWYAEGIYSRERIEKIIYPTMIWNEEQNDPGMDASLCNKMFKRPLISNRYDNIHIERFHSGEDIAIIYPLMLNINTLSIHHKAYYYHRQRVGGKLPPYIVDDRFFDNLYILYKYLRQTFSGQEMFMRQIDLYYMRLVMEKGRQYKKSWLQNDQVFPFDKVSKGERIVLYGAGNVGRLYHAQLLKVDYCEVVLWVDRNHENFEEAIKSPSEIRQTNYEKVVIAIKNERVRKEVKNTLLEMGVAEEAIV